MNANTRRRVFLVTPTSAWCAGVGQHRLRYTSNKFKLLASDPEAVPIGCTPFKKSSDRKLAKRKRKINRRLASLPALVLSWAIYLARPFSLHPTFIVLPFATVFVLSLAIAASTFKKYL